MHSVKSTPYASDYRAKIRFDDGRTKLVDLDPCLDGPVYEPLEDVTYFGRFQVSKDIDTAVWPGQSHLNWPTSLFRSRMQIDRGVRQQRAFFAPHF